MLVDNKVIGLKRGCLVSICLPMSIRDRTCLVYINFKMAFHSKHYPDQTDSVNRVKRQIKNLKDPNTAP